MSDFNNDFFEDLLATESLDSGKTIGELINEKTNGQLLVSGQATYELAETHKHDFEIMKKCCLAELENMKITGLIAAPYYFERAAILARKERDYAFEVEIIETYINEIATFYKAKSIRIGEGVMAGPTYKALEKRLVKAKQLLMKSL
ncbi:hypothetical protein [Enterobacter sp.]|uniref:hypothetical protein n=1 Tax=Enterobacter sp. TaxID=42895 RepID=UPI00296F35C4|nr:hypothetical protein [Enterobacter sp.]